MTDALFNTFLTTGITIAGIILTVWATLAANGGRLPGFLWFVFGIDIIFVYTVVVIFFIPPTELVIYKNSWFTLPLLFLIVYFLQALMIRIVAFGLNISHIFPNFIISFTITSMIIYFIIPYITNFMGIITPIIIGVIMSGLTYFIYFARHQ